MKKIQNYYEFHLDKYKTGHKAVNWGSKKAQETTERLEKFMDEHINPNTQTYYKQIEDFGWLGIFNEILVTERKKSKLELMHKVLKGSKKGWMIGDTGKDIQAGKKLSLKTAAVLTGFLNKKVLISYTPDLILDDVTNFKI